MAPLVASGDAAACLCNPDFAISHIAGGDIEILYEGRTASQLFADEFSDGHVGPMVNVFAAPTAWVEHNREEAEFLLTVWQRGIEEWKEHRDEIIEAYPQHFAVESPDEIAAMQDWFDTSFDWFVDSVYLDEEWIEGELSFMDLMRDSGFMGADVENPDFLVIEPTP
jgi:ABC-type nitrate/sulfonate/bicarbonate transport system substrate-binding protein